MADEREGAGPQSESDNEGFIVVSKSKGKKRKVASRRNRENSKTENQNKEPTEKPKKEIQPILVQNVNPTVVKNALKLSGLIKREKPNATIEQIKPIRNNAILIYPSDEKSANILLKPWSQESELGKPKPKLPQNKSLPSYGVVICGVNPEITENEIKVSLIDQAYEPKYIKRLISNVTKESTWKIKVIFSHIEETEDLISSGFYLGYVRHRVEPYRELPAIVQCFKCQGFGHTLKDCPNNSKCLRCGGLHQVKDCILPKEDKKCANCGGNHVALYKGCPSYRQARLEASKDSKTYASVAKATPVEVTTKIEKTEKLKFMVYTAELIKACLQKVNLKISTSDIANYSATLALSYLNVNVKGEELFQMIINQTVNEPVQPPPSAPRPTAQASSNE
ncbi:hypothetical protein HOLleu_27572 [Holothuria leucospilota]|uniref:CCHC-type domain-containing protein n=1 Tax=Holothuria leucospilota TaxID=206669 RepID=A0A9Q1BQG5_HOLLE|nr:hypothetical protein HOLleu_27572 [Holothuria leucospilota]